jgi:hypothetical protein
VEKIGIRKKGAFSKVAKMCHTQSFFWYILSHSTSPPIPHFYDGFFRDRVSLLPRLVSNYDPPDLCLLSSWDYMPDPLVPGKHTTLNSRKLDRP